MFGARMREGCANYYKLRAAFCHSYEYIRESDVVAYGESYFSKLGICNHYFIAGFNILVFVKYAEKMDFIVMGYYLS